MTEQGARLEKRYHTLEVIKHDVVLMRVPRARVGEVVLVGNVGVTTPAMRALLGDGIGLTLLTQAGKLLGRLRPAEQLNLPLRHKQYECAHDRAFCLEIGRAIVAGSCATAARWRSAWSGRAVSMSRARSNGSTRR
ncbi:MAG: CRISPR-associated endonuclease Cas1 [Anaerolineae bacterium]|nr:CRISPR-associated endonuclease Cas1 [Anaerolineae bacterium]